MTLRKAVFAVTVGAGGVGSDDAHLRSSVRDRGARIERVAIDRSAALLGPTLGPTVTISELDNVADEDWNDSTEDYALGRQLVFIPASAKNSDGVIDSFAPRASVVTNVGASPTTDVLDARPFIETSDLRCDVAGGTEGDEYTVTVYYQTAGDYRF